jgi:NAD(P)H-flavin reductase
VPPLHRRSLPVTAVEAVGAYTLLRLRNDGGDAGRPGQFFMLQADPEPAAAYLPRALSAAWANEREIGFLIDTRGEGTRGLAAAARISLLGPLGKGFRIAEGPALLVGGGIGAAVLPWLRSELARAGRTPRTLLGFRSPAHAVCAALVDPEADVVLESVLVTEPRARSTPVARIRCCRRWPPSAPSTTSAARWQWRRRWPAGSAPATAARCASTAPGGGSASRVQ